MVFTKTQRTVSAASRFGVTVRHRRAQPADKAVSQPCEGYRRTQNELDSKRGGANATQLKSTRLSYQAEQGQLLTAKSQCRR